MLESRRKTKGTRLVEAAEVGDISKINIFLKDGKFMRQCSAEAINAAFLVASKNGHTPVVKAILAKPHLVSRISEKCADASLGMAVAYDHKAVMTAMFANEDFMSCVSEDGIEKALLAVIEKGARNTLTFLLASEVFMAKLPSQSVDGIFGHAVLKRDHDILAVIFNDQQFMDKTLDSTVAAVFYDAACHYHLDIVLGIALNKTCVKKIPRETFANVATILIEGGYQEPADLVKESKDDVSKESPLHILIGAALQKNGARMKEVLSDPDFVASISEKDIKETFFAVGMTGSWDSAREVLNIEPLEAKIPDIGMAALLALSAQRGEAPFVDLILGKKALMAKVPGHALKNIAIIASFANRMEIVEKIRTYQEKREAESEMPSFDSPPSILTIMPGMPNGGRGGMGDD